MYISPSIESIRLDHLDFLHISAILEAELTAIYGSLNDVTVNVGDNVKQGDVIAKAGTNTIDAKVNNHLHFALMKNETLLNPNKLYGQEIKKIV
jgi:murein DD-endopeptidase MepM/ murein hydrolase activator NlpD